MGFEKTIIRSPTITDTKKPERPNLTIKNPIDKNIFVNSIVLTADTNFIIKGKIIVMVGGVTVFEPEEGEFQFIRRPTIPVTLLDTELNKQEKIEFFIWNGLDSSAVDITIEVKLSEKKDSVSAVGGGGTLTITPQDVRRRNSISENLFPRATYSSSPTPKIIDMNGYSKMILLIAGTLGEIPTVISNTTDIVDVSSAVDGDLASTTLNGNVASSHDVIVDFGDISSRTPKAKFGITSAPGNDDYELAVSDDNISYNTVDSISSQPVGTYTLQGAQQSFRYLRLRAIHINLTIGRFNISEIYNSDEIGGTASLSFEVFDVIINQWIEILNAGSLNSITAGSAISIQIGDVIPDVGSSKFNAILPSTPTNFRAVLTIFPNINTAVSIIKVD